MSLSDFLSNEALKKADEKFHEGEKAFQERVAQTTKTRLLNNLAQGVK